MPAKKQPHKRTLSISKEYESATTKRTRQSPRAVQSSPSLISAKKKTAQGKASPADTDDDPDDSGSDYDEVQSNAEEESEDDQSAETEYSEEDPKKSKRGKSSVRPGGKRAGGSTSTTAAPPSAALKAKELLRPGVKTGLGPGTQVVMKKPKARQAGAVPYMDNTIHPNTMLFLADLAANNSRQWLKMNDPDYRASLADFKSFIERLSEKIIEIDDTVPELPLKDLVFKVHRDVRFSKDQTPYKTNFSAAWSRTGKKGAFAKYYFQIKPSGCMIAGGLWQPDAQQLAAIRRDIDRRPNRIKQCLRQPGMRREFLGGVKDNDREVVERLVEENKESALKTKPKGFDSEHKEIELLRLRNFTVHHRFGDNEVVGPHGMDRVAQVFQCLVPFITYLNSVVMPDEDSDEEDVEGSDDNGSDEDMDED